MIFDQFFIKKAFFRRLENSIKTQISNLQFDAPSSPLSNGENHSSLFCFYETLFKKYLRAFMLPAHMRKKQILSSILLL